MYLMYNEKDIVFSAYSLLLCKKPLFSHRFNIIVQKYEKLVKDERFMRKSCFKVFFVLFCYHFCPDIFQLPL